MEHDVSRDGGLSEVGPHRASNTHPFLRQLCLEEAYMALKMNALASSTNVREYDTCATFKKPIINVIVILGL